MKARCTGLAVVSGIARITGTHRRTARVVTRPVTAAGCRLTGVVSYACAVDLRVPRQAIAALCRALVVFAHAILIGTRGVVRTGIRRQAHPVTVVGEILSTLATAIPGVALAAGAHDGTGAVVTGAVIAAGARLALLTRYLHTNALTALETRRAIRILLAATR
jgi:hypothetical protein